MQKANETIRNKLKDNGIRHWMLADALGVDESTLVKWLRKPLSEEKEVLLHSKINDLIAVNH